MWVNCDKRNIFFFYLRTKYHPLNYSKGMCVKPISYYVEVMLNFELLTVQLDIEMKIMMKTFNLLFIALFFCISFSKGLLTFFYNPSGSFTLKNIALLRYFSISHPTHTNRQLTHMHETTYLYVSYNTCITKINRDLYAMISPQCKFIPRNVYYGTEEHTHTHTAINI